MYLSSLEQDLLDMHKSESSSSPGQDLLDMRKSESSTVQDKIF